MTMKLPDDAIVVRPSAMATYNNCQLAVVELPGADHVSSMQAARGTGIHLLIEQHLSGQPTTTLSNTVELWVNHMRERDEDITVLASGSRIAEVADQIFTAYELWVEQFWVPMGDSLTVVGVEQGMAFKLGDAPSGRPIFLRGTSDLLTTTSDGLKGKVWDWKSASTGWSSNKTIDMVQHTAYALLADSYHYGKGIVFDEAAYVVYNIKTQQWAWDEYTLHVSDEEKARVREEFFKMGKVLDVGGASGTPMKRGASWGQDGRGWWCSPKWCNNWNVCDAKFLLKDGKANEPRDVSVTWK